MLYGVAIQGRTKTIGLFGGGHRIVQLIKNKTRHKGKHNSYHRALL